MVLHYSTQGKDFLYKLCIIIYCIVYCRRGETKYFEFQHAINTAVLCLTVSCDRKYLLCGFSNKWICCWDIESGEVLGSIMMNKRPIALQCAMVDINEALIVAERGEDVFGINIPTLTRRIKLLGHTTSVCTDVCISPRGDLVVTCDRDEKIRLSKFPHTLHIHGYLLGHTDVISCICAGEMMNTPFIVSAGWDHQIILWDIDRCVACDTIPTNTGDNMISTPECSDDMMAIETMEDENDLDNLHHKVGVEVEVEVDDQEAIAGQCDAVEANEIENTLPEKAYDETKAGKFPLLLSVISLPLSSYVYSYVAVLTRHDCAIQIYGIERDDDTTLQFANDKLPLCTIAVPEPPVDISFTAFTASSSSESDPICTHVIDLVVLLPAPHYLQMYSLQISSNGSVSAVLSENSDFIVKYNDYATAHGKQYHNI